MISRPTSSFRHDANKSKLAEIQRINESINSTNRVGLVDVIIQALRKQRRLLSVLALDKSFHDMPRIRCANHIIVRLFTQAGPIPETITLII